MISRETDLSALDVPDQIGLVGSIDNGGGKRLE
jgi:hypothetical protein